MNQMQPSEKMISLMEWPQNPSNQFFIQLSPISSKIIADSGISVQQIMPISISKFLGVKILNEDNIDQLVNKYSKYNRQRIKKVQKLQSQRNQYEYHNLHKRESLANISTHDLLPSEQFKTIEGYHGEQKAVNNFTIQGNQSHLTFSIKSQSMRAIQPGQLQSGQRHKINKSRKLVTHFQKTPSNSEKKPYHSSNKKTHTSKNTAISNTKLNNKSLTGLRSPKNKPNKVNHLQDSHLDYFGSPCQSKLKKNQLLKSRRLANDHKETRKQRNTQRPSYVPINQYYDSSTSTRLLQNNNKNSITNFYISPILDQLTNAVDQLIQLTQKQERQIQMLENLVHQDDLLEQKQRKRLTKIHNIERDQLKNHIYGLKQKIQGIRNGNGMGITCTL